VIKMWFSRLKPTPDCRIWRWVPSPQSTRKRYSSCLMIWAERPRWTEGAEAEVPRNTISNKAGAFHYQVSEVRNNVSSAPCSLNCTLNEPGEIPDHLCYNHRRNQQFDRSTISDPQFTIQCLPASLQKLLKNLPLKPGALLLRPGELPPAARKGRQEGNQLPPRRPAVRPCGDRSPWTASWTCWGSG